MNKLPKNVQVAMSDENLQIDPSFQKNLKSTLFKGENMSKKISPVTKFKNLMSSHKFIPIGVAFVMIAAVGAGTYTIGFRKSENAVLRSVELPSDLSDVKPIDEIRNLATVGLIDGVTISSVELGQEEDTLVYKVKYSDGTFKLYNARSGEMVAKSDLEIDSSVPADFIARVTIDEARSTAQGVFPGKTVVKIEMETEEGIVVYSVRFSDDSRVDVSAVNGSVVRTRDGSTEERTSSENSADDSSDGTNEDSNKDSDDSVDSEDHQEEDIEDDGDRSGSNSGSSSGSDRSGKED